MVGLKKALAVIISIIILLGFFPLYQLVKDNPPTLAIFYGFNIVFMVAVSAIQRGKVNRLKNSAGVLLCSFDTRWRLVSIIIGAFASIFLILTLTLTPDKAMLSETLPFYFSLSLLTINLFATLFIPLGKVEFRENGIISTARYIPYHTIISYYFIGMKLKVKYLDSAGRRSSYTEDLPIKWAGAVQEQLASRNIPYTLPTTAHI
ncbi:MAG: hypothetical protein HXX08_04395 [Chloroflexi bacterium]|uniref:DUF5673 domain-containing protein n=1 Tax=Candidatus Chlorohelix allophototropha TaxID=3003348 RepID=A0A8T7M0W1_9CHLR|nr:hypothetical protein [Chloroflexota bacterium]WJW66981.1 hypothetical protein OZ401_000227 [Chloroflexota bacterium L227-S17]